MAAGATYEPIATQTLAIAAATITFSSIAATYTDLRLVATGTVASAAPDVWIRFNSDTATNYSLTAIQGNGTAASSFATTSATKIDITPGVGWSSTIPSMVTMDVFSYAGSTYKTVLANENADRNGSGVTTATVGLWRSTAAITRIDITNSSSVNFSVGTTATLYGIKAA